MLIRNLAAPLLLGALVLAAASCGGDGDANREAARPTAEAGKGAPPADLDAEIARLERLTERNPADDESRADLVRAYVRRADAHRAAGRLREALADYRRARSIDPDNEEALRNLADLTPQVEGTPQEGEYGEPAPPPISPHVEGEDKATPTPGKP